MQKMSSQYLYCKTGFHYTSPPPTRALQTHTIVGLGVMVTQPSFVLLQSMARNLLPILRTSSPSVCVLCVCVCVCEWWRGRGEGSDVHSMPKR